MDSLQSMIKFAVSKEEEAASFYEFLASVINSENIKKVLLQLSREEKAHKQTFENIASGEKPTAAGLEHPEVDMKISDYLVDMAFDPDMSYQDALILAMKREEKSYNLYRDLAGSISDENLKGILLNLANEEARHKLRLESIYDAEILTED